MKADKDSPNLAQLQQASRGVNQATAAVVASTTSGKSQIEETGSLLEAVLFFSSYLAVLYILSMIPITHSSVFKFSLIFHLFTLILIFS